jgi:hypothetical protein
MKPNVFFSLGILAFIIHSCNSENKEIRGVWTDQEMSETDIYYLFERDGTYTHLHYGPASSKGKAEWVFRDGSVGHYKYIGHREFNLYQIDIDLSPIVGLPVTDPEIGLYLSKSIKTQGEPDFDIAKPSFLARIQGDGENLHIIQNGNVIIELRRKHIKFGDKR